MFYFNTISKNKDEDVVKTMGETCYQYPHEY